LAGYLRINGVCGNCNIDQVYDASSQICVNLCGSLQIFNNLTGKCDCKTGYYLVQGTCGTCSSGYSYDSNTQTCIPVCKKF
jgi:hypothetical protein